MKKFVLLVNTYQSVNSDITCYRQDVKFPLSLDVFDLCSEDLQKKLIPVREKFKEQEDKEAEEATKVPDRNSLWPCHEMEIGTEFCFCPFVCLNSGY